jgi:class 3 adenylate cyclase
VVRAIAVVVVVVGVGEVFVLEQSEGEDAVSELGGEFVEERRLRLGVAFGEVFGRGTSFDGDLFGSALFDA